MEIIVNNKSYEVIIIYKNIKNVYLRVKKDLKIYITCKKNTSKFIINSLINNNLSYIEKALNIYEKNNLINERFRYLGNTYEINYINKNDLIFGSNCVFIGKNYNLDKWYKKEAKKIFKERLIFNYNKFIEEIPFPDLKIRLMKTRWGVCNVKTKSVTLNLELIKLDIKYLDYVIIHELSHLIYPNHSKSFWNIVIKYCPNYKTIRKEMKNIL